jgi:hypothetical protein
MNDPIELPAGTTCPLCLTADRMFGQQDEDGIWSGGDHVWCERCGWRGTVEQDDHQKDGPLCLHMDSDMETTVDYVEKLRHEHNEARQWKPANKPPTHSRSILMTDGRVIIVGRHFMPLIGYCTRKDAGKGKYTLTAFDGITHWMELPSLPAGD